MVQENCLISSKTLPLNVFPWSIIQEKCVFIGIPLLYDLFHPKMTRTKVCLLRYFLVDENTRKLFNHLKTAFKLLTISLDVHLIFIHLKL